MKKTEREDETEMKPRGGGDSRWSRRTGWGAAGRLEALWSLVFLMSAEINQAAYEVHEA
jgi:hypothetical protein